MALPVRAAAPPTKPSPGDRAVHRALAYLHKNQRANGSWPVARGGKNPAIDALAVMAFLSAGHAPGKGPYGDTIEKGIRAVLAAQQPNGLIATQGGQEMYHHGIATLMLAQAHVAGDGKFRAGVRKPLDRAVALILKAQRTQAAHRGGWRYRVAPYDGADLSVTGWQVLALAAARDAGCDVPGAALDNAVAYVRRCQDPRTRGFRYQPYANVTVCCTATGILSLGLLARDGPRDPDAARAAAYLARQKPAVFQPYFLQSAVKAAQAASLLRGNWEQAYRKAWVPVLLSRQQPTGAWAVQGYEGAYGPTLTTSLAVLALTASQRRLPPFGPRSAGQGQR
jgi:hypothetical protein